MKYGIDCFWIGKKPFFTSNKVHIYFEKNMDFPLLNRAVVQLEKPQRLADVHLVVHYFVSLFCFLVS